MSHNDGHAEETALPSATAEHKYSCPYCGVEQNEPRTKMLGGGISGAHKCFCLWEDREHGPLVCVAVGICCYRMAHRGLGEHFRHSRRWERIRSPRAVDWDEVASCAVSMRRIVGDLWHQAGWPEASPDHARLLSEAHRDRHWPQSPNEFLGPRVERSEMIATADEIAEWLMLARDRAAHASTSVLEGSADVYAAGELLARLADALAAWDEWRQQLVIEDAARARRILAAAAFRWGSSAFMFRHFVADHLDAALARRLGERDIAVLACALHLRRRGRPRNRDDEGVKLLKQDCGLEPEEEVPDKIEALQRLAASIGIPRMSPDAIEDQVQPLLSRLADVRREREAAFAALQNVEFESTKAAREAFEDADIQASVMEDEAIRSCGTRKKRPKASGSKPAGSRVVRNSRRAR